MAQAPVPVDNKPQIAESALEESGSSKSNYKGFVAGVFSGVAKLSGMLISYVAAGPKLIADLGNIVGHPYVRSLPSSLALLTGQIRYHQGSLADE